MQKSVTQNSIGISIFTPKEEIALRNKIIIRIKEKSFTTLLAKASRFCKTNEDAINTVNDFIADKICPLDIIELLQIASFGRAYIAQMIRNYIISRIRIEKRIRLQKEKISTFITEDDIIIEASGIDETDKQIQIIKNSIIEKFNEKYAIIFELKAHGIENKIIAEKTAETENNIRVAMSRIRKFLREAS